MKPLFLAVAMILAGGYATNAQTVADCPHPDGCVVISRAAAIKNLQTDDENKAMKSEIAVLKQAVADHKDIETNLKVELAKATGELTGSQQMNVRQTAIIELLVKKVGKRCSPLSILCL